MLVQILWAQLLARTSAIPPHLSRARKELLRIRIRRATQQVGVHLVEEPSLQLGWLILLWARIKEEVSVCQRPCVAVSAPFHFSQVCDTNLCA